jgi:transcriptional regulator with XRE-family HTH domain
MKNREQLLRSPDYWFEDAQNELYRQVISFMEKEGLNQTQLAARLQVSKGYISQILKGEFNYTLKKLIELSLAINKVPHIEYKSIEQVIHDDQGTYNINLSGSSDLKVNSEAPYMVVTHEAA